MSDLAATVRVMTLALALLVGLALGLVTGLLAGRLLARRDEALLASSFQGLAAQALRDSDGESRAAVGRVVAPLTEQLHRVEQQLHELEVDRARTMGELRAQVTEVRVSSEQLGRQTSSLVDALRKPQARGRWGEIQLRRVVEMAGMADRCDFTEQSVLRDASRPDLVVRLAGGRTVVVDAKVTLAAYLEAAEATDDATAAERMAAHARHLRAHVDRLADKAYWQQLADTPEFVVLFVPGEAFLAPALEHDPTLLEHAITRGVHVATPTTLVSMLRTVAHSWRQQSLTDDARAVLDAGRELHARLSVLGGHVDKLGRSLGRSVEAFNATVGSLEAQVLPSARRMSQRELVDPAPVECAPRRVAAPELLDQTG
jgi:DNA recombination protein RmuC